jgi:hypothetical protein
VTGDRPNLRLILEESLYKEDLQELCERLRLPVGGAREDLIVRLLASPGFDPKDALRYLDKTQLIELCQRWNLDDTGKWDPLSRRILRALQGPPEA